MDVNACKALAAGISVIALFGAGIGMGKISASYVESVARNPQAKDDIRSAAMLGFAFTESVALLAFIAAALIMYTL